MTSTMELWLLAQANPYVLNIWGWTVMVLSISSVLALVTFCLAKVLRLPPVEEDTLKGPLQTETRDIE